MPYLGNTPTANFATVTKDTFSGNGSTTAFTLSKTATTNGVAVYVENVRQIPTTAYAISGTTLTFTAAPVSGTNNIYVMHHNTPVSTATHPSTQALEATSGIFSTTLGVTGTTKLGEIASIGQATPLSPNDATAFLHIGDNNNQDTSIILEDAVEIWEIYQNDTLSFRKDTTIVQELHRDGYVTQPLQPCFSVGFSGGNHNTNDANFVFNSEAFDIGDNYNNSTGVFTAPVAGRYYFSANVMTHNNNSTGYLYWSYYHNSSYVAHCYQYQDTANAHQMFQMPLLLNMAASDTLSVRSRAGTWYGGATQHGRFEGYLIA